MGLLTTIKEKRRLALLSRLKKAEEQMKIDIEEDAELEEYQKRKAKVDEYYKKRKKSSGLHKIVNVIKEEIIKTGEATKKNPSPLFTNAFDNQNDKASTKKKKQNQDRGFLGGGRW